MNSNTSDSAAKEWLAQDSKLVHSVLEEISKVIVGQHSLNRSLVIGLLTGGHVLLEGLPGLAKTLSIKTLASTFDAKFQRIQFTPDLLPSDLIGTMVYRQDTQEFVPKKGPIFANLILADEINRAPAKVQSALLEAMAEKQVTIGDKTYSLEEPFLVMATQNPIEQEGTYPLPEAQLDRFMLKVKVAYPSREEERTILDRMVNQTNSPHVSPLCDTKKVLKIRDHLDEIYIDDRLRDYIVRLVLATRKEVSLTESEASLKTLKDIHASLWVGASPRASIFLARSARAMALIENRHFVVPDDVKAVALEVLRHRLILTYEAQAKNLTTDEIILNLLESVNVP
jgi:MoxR-like ATPase